MNVTALIAEDEPLLADHLQAELARLWPELHIVANVRHGAAAVEQALALCPEVVFLDIRMPGMSGLEAAQALVEDWPDSIALPLLVFVTAYDEYAVQAFEHAAVDYLLKPVRSDRLKLTCERVQTALGHRAERARSSPAIPASDAAFDPAIDAALAQLRNLLHAPHLTARPRNPIAPRLNVIQAAVGAVIHMVPIEEVIYFEAADKYVRMVTTERDYWVRTSLREWLPQLDDQTFWQIHRGVVVNAQKIATAVRDESGKLTVSLRGHRDVLVASRLYAHRFKAM